MDAVAELLDAEVVADSGTALYLASLAVIVVGLVAAAGVHARQQLGGIKSHGACRIALRRFRKRGKNAWTFLLHFCQSLFKMDTLEDGWIRINYPIQYYWQVQAVCL